MMTEQAAKRLQAAKQYLKERGISPRVRLGDAYVPPSRIRHSQDMERLQEALLNERRRP